MVEKLGVTGQTPAKVTFDLQICYSRWVLTKLKSHSWILCSCMLQWKRMVRVTNICNFPISWKREGFCRLFIYINRVSRWFDQCHWNFAIKTCNKSTCVNGTRSRVRLFLCLHILTSVSALPSTDPSLAATTLVLHWQTGCQKGRALRWRSQAFSVIPCCDTWLVAPEPRCMMSWLTATENMRSLTFLFL